MEQEKVISIEDIDPRENPTLDLLRYIELTKDVEYRDFLGRFTRLIKGAMGFIVDNDNAERILELISKKGMERYFKILEDAIDLNRTPAVIAGYLCILDTDDFIRIPRPKMTPIPIIF